MCQRVLKRKKKFMSYCNAIEQYANDKRFSIIQLSVGANRDADPGFEGEKTRNKKTHRNMKTERIFLSRQLSGIMKQGRNV